MTKVLNIRFGYDGGGMACGPVEGEYNVEAMFLREDGTTYFVSESRFEGYIEMNISDLSLFDINMQYKKDGVDIEKEAAKVKNNSFENYSFDTSELDETIFDSKYLNALKFVDNAMDYICETYDEEWLSSEDYLADYVDKDIDSLGLEFEGYDDENDA